MQPTKQKKKVFGRIWSDSSNAELLQLPSGSLYLVRPSSTLKGTRECIYKDAVAAIRRTGTAHNYQLVVVRAYEEGEEQLLDEEAEGEPDDERVFLIDEQLHFRAGTTAAPDEEGGVGAGAAGEEGGEVPCFIWRADPSGGSTRSVGGGEEEEDLLEFVVDPKQVNNVTRSVFEVTYLQCAFERKFGRSHEDATDEDLDKLKYR